MKDAILKIAKEIKQEIIDIRRQIHMHPETGFEELPTKPTILDETVAKKNPKIAIKTAPINPTLTIESLHPFYIIVNLFFKFFV